MKDTNVPKSHPLMDKVEIDLNMLFVRWCWTGFVER
jgi:hypothetical protein